MYREQLDWFSTDGGQFLVVPQKHASEWFGADGIHDDYDRAAKASPDGSIGSLTVGTGQGLVYGTGEEQTAWYPLNDEKTEGMLVWWIYAPSKEDALRSLSAVPDSIWKKEDIVFENDDSIVRLINSADSGSGATFGYREFSLQPGKYEIYSAEDKPDKRTFFYLYRLKLKSD